MAQETKKNSHLRHQVISSTQGRTTRHNSGAKRPALAPICLHVINLGRGGVFPPPKSSSPGYYGIISTCRTTKHSSDGTGT